MTSICLAMCLLAPAQGARERYAKPELLVEPAELKKPEVAKRFVILDARGADEYRAGHVAGAVRVEAGKWADLFQNGADPAGWSKRIGAVGIDGKKPVVIYDDDRSRTAARMWWVLRYWGVGDVRILNGGWNGWKAAGGAVEKGVNKPKPVEPTLTAQAGRLATREQITEGLKKGGFGQLLDARSKDEFCGEAMTAKRNGAMPGARHLEWTQTIDRKTGRFKSAAELTRLFKDAGIDPEKPATTYCQSGGRAAVVAFVVELYSGKAARNYYRSWAEWGNHPDTPIEKPKK
jgi:thiosulfate/3-mercaptopyruvate sulfurtransferase